MEREKATVWVTKYALTEGIFEQLGEVYSPTMFTYGLHKNLHKNQWHRTKQEAITRAEQMRKAKIASLKKQVENLEKLRFE